MAKVLWLTKAQLAKNSTSKECMKWGLTMFPVYGTTPEKLATIGLLETLPTDLHIITNYHSLNNDPLFKKLHAVKWDIIVIDEVHNLKGGANATPTKLWKQTAKLVTEQVAFGNAFPIFLTASLINNKPEEVWAYLHMFDPIRFSDMRDFARIFGKKTWQSAGLTLDTDKLVKVLATNMIRRKKDEVGIQLPPKTFMPVEELDYDKQSEFGKMYEALKNDVLVEFTSMDDDATLNLGSLLAKLHYLRLALLSPGRMDWNYYPIDPETGERATDPIRKTFTFKPPYPKLDPVLEKIFELRDEGENVIVFSAQYNDPLDYLYTTLTEAGHSVGRIYGEHHKKSNPEEDFQQGRTNILLCNGASGAEGFNLHRCDDWPGGASHVIFLDRWWNPERNRQCEDRTWRTGTNKPVFIWKFFVIDSVDYLINAIEESKTAIAAGIVEDKRMRVGDWKNLLRKYLGS